MTTPTNNQIADELGSCPFCGGAPEVWTADDSGDDWYRVECLCGAMVGGSHVYDVAVANWNRRDEAVKLFEILQEADPDIAQLLTSIGGNYVLSAVNEAKPEARLDCMYRALGQCEVLKYGLLRLQSADLAVEEEMGEVMERLRDTTAWGRGVNDIAGHPRNWLSTAAVNRRAPVCVTGVMLRGVGVGADCHLVVSLEIDGRWVDVIQECAANPDTISHIVEPSGIRRAQGAK